MAKSLKELLNTFPFENGFNPRNAGPGTIKPEPSDRFTNDNEDAKQWLKETPKLYGTDIVRIMTQTDPHKTKKAIKKAADKVGGAIGGGVGAAIGSVTSKLAEFHPKFPDDWTKGEDGNPTGMEKNFYAGVVNGDYARGFYYNAYHKNSKSKLGQFLQANKNPEQVKNAILPALKSAAVGLAVGLVVAGATKLFSNKNKKKGKEGPEKPKKKEKQNNAFFNVDKFNKPYFPSTLLINEGFGENGYGLSFRNYSRLRQRNFNIGTLNYLEKDGATIIKDMAPTLDTTQFTDTDNTHGISDYYAQVFKNNTPQTRNEGNVILSATMFQNNYQPANQLQFIDPVNGGTYLTDRNAYASGRAVDDKVQNYSRFVDAEGNAFISFGKRNADGSYSDNDISKLASLNLRYGTLNTNLLTIKTAKPSDKLKWDSIGDPLNDPNFTLMYSQGSSYTKNFITNKNDSSFVTTTAEDAEILYAYDTTDGKTELITQNGGLSQTFGTSDTNLLELVIPDIGNKPNDYDVRIAGTDKVIATGKAGTDYFYDRKDINVLNIVSEEQSRFITGSIGPDSQLKQGYTSNVETQIGQQFGDAFISVDVDTSDEKQYQLPYKRIGGSDTVVRWNTKTSPFSANIDEIMTNDVAFIDAAIQTQVNVSPIINPYHGIKTQILEKNESDIVKVSIGGINFFATVANLSDKNTSNWDSVKPIGSGVNFYLFNNWERSISFDLTMYAEHEADLGWIWNKVNKLTSLTMGRPSGAAGAGYGVYGNILYLRIGDLIKENGFLTDVTMNVDTASPWEIDPKIGQLPFICTLSISFQVVRNDIGGGPNSSVNTTDEKPTTTKQNEQEKVSLKNLSNMDPNKEQFSLKNLSEKNPKKEKFSL
jgi:hypothetical protein